MDAASKAPRLAGFQAVGSSPSVLCSPHGDSIFHREIPEFLLSVNDYVTHPPTRRLPRPGRMRHVTARLEKWRRGSSEASLDSCHVVRIAGWLGGYLYSDVFAATLILSLSFTPVSVPVMSFSQFAIP